MVNKGIFCRHSFLPVPSKQVHVTFDRWHKVCHTTCRPAHLRMRIPQNSARFLASDDADTSDIPAGSLGLGRRKILQNKVRCIDVGDESKAEKSQRIYSTDIELNWAEVNRNGAFLGSTDLNSWLTREITSTLITCHTGLTMKTRHVEALLNSRMTTESTRARSRGMTAVSIQSRSRAFLYSRLARVQGMTTTKS